MCKKNIIFLFSDFRLFSFENKNESITSDSDIPNSFFSEKAENFGLNEVETDKRNKQDFSRFNIQLPFPVSLNRIQKGFLKNIKIESLLTN